MTGHVHALREHHVLMQACSTLDECWYLTSQVLVSAILRDLMDADSICLLRSEVMPGLVSAVSYG